MKSTLIKLFLAIFIVPVILTCVFASPVKACDGGGCALTVTCQSSPTSSITNPVDLNTPVTFTANATGGTGNYTYSWFSGCIGTDATCQNSYTSAGSYTANVTVSDGDDSQTASCTAFVAQSCVPQDHKACVGNNVYWFDSCNTQGNQYEACTSNQTCCNGACVNIACSTNSDCGTDGLVGNPFCQSGDVYKNFRTYTCNNPGTTSATCTHSDVAELQNTCTGNQTCTSGSCTTVACNSNSDCGTDGLIGNPFCKNGDVYQSYKTNTCNNPGTANSSCTATLADQLQTNCTSNQNCSNGSCITNPTNISVSCYATPSPVNTNQSVAFISTVSGGTGSYTYSWSGACSGSSQTCSNTFSSSGNQTATINVTSGSQTNSATCSVNVNQNCTQNSYQRCNGNNLYWYDSCGNQGNQAQYCPNGCVNNSCSNNNNISVQTNSATNINGNQATLNGYLYTGNNYGSNNYNTCNSTVWFQYGTTTSYGSQTNQQTQNYSGAFSQPIYNIYSGSTYHFRAVAQDCTGNMVYGQDMIIYSNNGSGTLNVSKTVKNLTTGSGFATSTTANPGDTLLFMITLQANNNQDVQNVLVRDSLPANLIYNNQLVVACTSNGSYNGNCNGNNYNYGGSITSGISLNTVYANQMVTITYQTQVAQAGNFSYGTTTLNNNVYVTSSNSGYNPTSSATVFVTRAGVLGASYISTGLTNNFWVDSFFLPLMLTLLGLWMWKSGMFFGIERWLDNKNKQRRGYKSDQELAKRIAELQRQN